MADDFDALRTIRSPLGELDAERASRMRARALSTVLTDEAPAAAPTDAPPARTRTQPGRDRRDVRRPGTGRSGEPLVPAARLEPAVHPAPTPLHRGASRGGDRRPFVVVAAAAAVVLIVLVGLGLARSGQREAVVTDQPTPTSVTDLAANAATVVDRPLPAGQYAHIVTEQADPSIAEDGSPQIQVRTRETWSTGAGAGRERYSDTEIVDDQGHTLGTLEPARVDDYPSDAPAFGSFGYDTLRSLPADAGSLRAALTDGTFGPPDEDAVLHRLIGEILILDSTPPAVRAAALTILAADGATVRPNVSDPAGHTGIGILAERADGRTSVFVVTRDGALLGQYDVATGAAPDPAAATGWTTLLDQDRVTTLP